MSTARVSDNYRYFLSIAPGLPGRAHNIGAFQLGRLWLLLSAGIADLSAAELLLFSTSVLTCDWEQVAARFFARLLSQKKPLCLSHDSREHEREWASFGYA